MRHRITVTALAAALAAVLTGAAAAATPASGTTTRTATEGYCGIAWGSLPKSGGALSGAPLLSTRTGQHACWDRLVFELDGPANGYAVKYGPVHTDGEGVDLGPYTAGGALLNVRILAPAHDGSRTATYPHRTGDHVATVLRYRTLRDVVFGGSVEGYTVFAVGVRAKLPFRMFVLSGPGTHSRIVLDVAHQW